MNRGMSEKNLMRVLPMPLDADQGMHDLGQIAANALSELWQAVDLPRLYARIDELPEGLLDIMARDFKVDWYDYDADVKTKRTVIKDSFYVHRHLGTPAAVKRAINDIFGEGYLEEWFEYGGDPYHFRVFTSNTTVMRQNRERFLHLLAIVKSVRSVLDSVVYYGESAPAETDIGTAVVAFNGRIVSALAMRNAGTCSDGSVRSDAGTCAIGVYVQIKTPIAMRNVGTANSSMADADIVTGMAGVSSTVTSAMAMRSMGRESGGEIDTIAATRAIGVSGQINSSTAEHVQNRR